MVVPVFITNCHVSEKLKIGPVMPQIRITKKAIIKAQGVPVALVTIVEKLLKKFLNLVDIYDFRFLYFVFKPQEKYLAKRKKN